MGNRSPAEPPPPTHCAGLSRRTRFAMSQAVATPTRTAADVVPNVEPIITDAHRAHFEKNGYMVVPTGIEPEKLSAVVDVIWDFLGMDPNDPNDWYREPHRTGGMIELYQHQALWDMRQHPRLYHIFKEFHGTGRLGVSLDRVSMKAPIHPDYPDYANPGFIHWDLDLDNLPPAGRSWVQGVIALTDTAADQGGFQCVPEVYQQFEELAASLSEEEQKRRRPDLEARGLHATPIPCKAGDLIIWDVHLLHGNGLNRSNRPRLAQYITMNPARKRDGDEEHRQRRIDAWQNRTAPGGSAFPGDPRGVEKERYQTAELTPLGRCLLGVDEWPEDVK